MATAAIVLLLLVSAAVAEVVVVRWHLFGYCPRPGLGRAVAHSRPEIALKSPQVLEFRNVSEKIGCCYRLFFAWVARLVPMRCHFHREVEALPRPAVQSLGESQWSCGGGVAAQEKPIVELDNCQVLLLCHDSLAATPLVQEDFP